MVAITIDPRQLAKMERALRGIEKGVPKAMAPAINRALSSGQTVIKREIRKEYVIKAKDIPTKIKRASYGNLKGEIIIQSGMLGLNKFRTRGGLGRRPLWAQVKVGGGGVIASGFWAGSGLYRRVGPPRLPIKRLMAIGAPIMASQPAVGPAANERMGEVLAKRMDHEMQRVLAGAGGG
jgi:minor tail protein Z (GPZ)